MRIVLDLQAAQCRRRSSDARRYVVALAKAIVRAAESHEIFVALNGRFPDSIDELRIEFAGILPRKQIRVFELPGPLESQDPANVWRSTAAGYLRECALADLEPDVVHLFAGFDGWQNDFVGSTDEATKTCALSVSLLDTDWLDCPHAESATHALFRERRIHLFQNADLVFTVSRGAREKAIAALNLTRTKVFELSPAPDLPIPGAIGEGHRKLSTLAGLNRRFLLCNPGDPAPGIAKKCVMAFCLVPAELRKGYQLLIAGELQDEERKAILSLCSQQGLAPDEDVVIRPQADADLLYSIAEAVLFPSSSEAVGLSLMNALSAGAAVLASNQEIFRELLDREDVLFDASEPADIAHRITQVLIDRDFQIGLKRWGTGKAAAFSWQRPAEQILHAFAQIEPRRSVHPVSGSPGKPTLAFVSPFPPERTGIAGYSARLASKLDKYYDVVCITDLKRIEDQSLSERFSVRNERWFEANGGRFDRILYQFGNSAAHKKMFNLLEQHPGVVVLHDFFLSDLLCWMGESGYAPGSFSRALYDSHGLSALALDNRDGRRATVARYPCNAALLRESIGVIVHSEHAIDLARAFYGNPVSKWMRRIPFLVPGSARIDRAEARKRLNMPAGAFIVCSFGWVTPLKLCDRLVNAWIGSPLLRGDDTRLVFVGATDEGVHGRDFRSTISRSSQLGSRIEMTGYIDEARYRDYLAGADLAIQLRTQSRGETSATIFDCMAAGLPLIVNAHGSAAELPDEVVKKIPDEFSDPELSQAIETLRSDPQSRHRLAAQSLAYLDETHQADAIARDYFETIEEFNARSPRAREQRLIKTIGRALTPIVPDRSDFAQVARALAANRSPFGLAQILIDITNITKLDLRTGIERVTRGILRSLIENPPQGYRIEPVRAVMNQYVYARRYIAESLQFKSNELADDPVETHPDDLFLGVDWPADVLPSLKGWFQTQQRQGLETLFVVYDLLPLLRPELFPPELPPMTLHWLRTVTEIADGLACISRTVADQLYNWLQKVNPHRLKPLPIGFFRLGADLRSSLPTRGLPANASEVISVCRSRPTFLIVGTVEPRKGHRLALAAMELVWSSNIDVNLVIIGKQGWMMDDFAGRVQHHPEHERRLFWYQSVTDEMLEQIYLNSTALIAASEGEGFGLPLIEAAQHKLPIIARDIPIFREVAAGHAYFFAGSDEKGLADAIRQWLTSGDAVPSSAGLPIFTWEESARDLLKVALQKRWYRWWHGAQSPACKSHEPRRS